LEDEKAQLTENEANYKVAYLKEKSKNREPDPDESEEERIRRITREEIAQTRISQIDKETYELHAQEHRENKELKLALLNKTTATPPAGMGTSNESMPVKDTKITKEQELYFKTVLHWTDKEFQRYKKNLDKYSGR
jgi:hypothetical protein